MNRRGRIIIIEKEKLEYNTIRYYIIEWNRIERNRIEYIQYT